MRACRRSIPAGWGRRAGRRCSSAFSASHEWTLLILPAVMSAAMLALAYAFGRTFFSHEAGLITLAIFAVMPIDCRFATWLLSDVPSAAWAGGGILALVLGKRAATNSRESVRRADRRALLRDLVADAHAGGAARAVRPRRADPLVLARPEEPLARRLRRGRSPGDFPRRGLLLSRGDGRLPLSAPLSRENLRDAQPVVFHRGRHLRLGAGPLCARAGAAAAVERAGGAAAERGLRARSAGGAGGGRARAATGGGASFSSRRRCFSGRRWCSTSARRA